MMGNADQPTTDTDRERHQAAKDAEAFRGLLVSMPLAMGIWLAIGGVVLLQRLLTA
jgi:hypothetical protein